MQWWFLDAEHVILLYGVRLPIIACVPYMQANHAHLRCLNNTIRPTNRVFFFKITSSQWNLEVRWDVNCALWIVLLFLLMVQFYRKYFFCVEQLSMCRWRVSWQHSLLLHRVPPCHRCLYPQSNSLQLVMEVQTVWLHLCQCLTLVSLINFSHTLLQKKLKQTRSCFKDVYNLWHICSNAEALSVTRRDPVT